MNEDELIKKLREAFKAEAGERLGNMSTGLLALEQAPDPDEQAALLETVFREAHSLKGAARAVNLAEIEALCQAMESVFAAARQKEYLFSREMFDALQGATEAMEDFMAHTGKDLSPAAGEKIVELIQQLEMLRESDEAPAGRENIKDSMAGRVVENKSGNREKTPETKVSGDRTKDRKIQKKSDSEIITPPKGPDAVAADEAAGLRDSPAVGSRPLIADTVRISTAKLDALFLKAEELLSLKLVSNQHLDNLRNVAQTVALWKKKLTGSNAELRALRRHVQKNDKLAGLLEFSEWNREHLLAMEQEMGTLVKTAEQDNRALGGMVDDLLDNMKETTMLPFTTLFEILPRMVRSIGRDIGKEADLVLHGGEIEIDRRILEDLKDPIIHLLRNSIDHGLETSEKRIERKKPGRGTITLAVSQTESSKVDITLSDDGGGIDLESVKAKAVKLGIISKSEAGRLDDRNTLPLIFKSAVSTSAIITEISGRGLGLAIVREKIENLGGLVELENRPGRGASFRMQVPVTLATFRGILIRTGEHRFIVPSAHVACVLKTHRDEIKTVESRATIPLDGRAVSLMELSGVLGLTASQGRDDPDINLTIMVLGTGDQRVGFQIDEVLSEQEVLVKGLGRQLARVPNIAGATILGNGKVVPVLSVRDLLASPAENTGGISDAGAHKNPAGSTGTDQAQKSILIAEDSITSRMLLKNILEGAGYLVKTAVDGMDAFTTLKTQEFDVVVSDVEMPRMNGFELTGKIRGDKKLGETPVVLVTSLDSREDRERGIDAGANAYIVKSSFDQSNLLDVIRRLI